MESITTMKAAVKVIDVRVASGSTLSALIKKYMAPTCSAERINCRTSLVVVKTRSNPYPGAHSATMTTRCMIERTQMTCQTE